jgi:tRNA threonylcarbamoyladenosine biosynthesis protein TsaE
MELDKIIITNSEKETFEQGNIFAEVLVAGDIVLFTGDLGAGKTEFIKGICDYFGVEELVTSPTFTIINQYFATNEDAVLVIYHLDLYRIKTEKELVEIGLSECLEDAQSIKLIEWAEKASSYYSDQVYRIAITLAEDDSNKRTINITKR